MAPANRPLTKAVVTLLCILLILLLLESAAAVADYYAGDRPGYTLLKKIHSHANIMHYAMSAVTLVASCAAAYSPISAIVQYRRSLHSTSSSSYYDNDSLEEAKAKLKKKVYTELVPVFHMAQLAWIFYYDPEAPKTTGQWLVGWGIQALSVVNVTLVCLNIRLEKKERDKLKGGPVLPVYDEKSESESVLEVIDEKPGSDSVRVIIDEKAPANI